MARSNGTGGEAVAQAALTGEPDFLRAIVERPVQEILETELTAHRGATRSERSAGRKGPRNGYRPRTLTRVVPPERGSAFSTPLFARYQRHEKALVLALLEM